jgi:AcrR family transcriptional regulator
MPGDKVEGMRERKKRRTREQIITAARELFVERGYHQTGIADVAERADIATSTFFGYFSTKSELLFSSAQEIAADFIEAIESRASGETAIDATIRWHSKFSQRRLELGPDSPELAWMREQRKIVAGDPVLEALELQQWVETNRVLAEAIANDLGVDETDLRPRLIAATKVALYVAFYRNLGTTEELVNSVDMEQYVGECLKAAADAIASVPQPHSAQHRLEARRSA